jgi:hypothetical protein
MTMATYSLVRPLVLALDLDSTFVENFPEERQQFIELVTSSKHAARLVYMSHDSAENLIRLAADAGLTVPDMILADSGTTALKGDGTGTVEPLQRSILQLWPGKDAVVRAMKGIEAIWPLEDLALCR